MLSAEHEFLVRVGSNVQLLTKLGYSYRQQDNTVYLWPTAKQSAGQPHSNPEASSYSYSTVAGPLRLAIRM